MTEQQSLTDRIRHCVADFTCVEPDTITLDTTLQGDLHLYGDDIDDLIASFSDNFEVDMAGYRWYHHTGPEGFNPLWVFRRPWWDKKKKTPIRVDDLLRSAAEKKWTISYDDV